MVMMTNWNENEFNEFVEKCDALVRADAELLYCWYCSGYYPREKMGDVACLECEGLGCQEVLENMPVFVRALEQIKAKVRRVNGIGKLIQMTLEEGRK